MLQWKSGGIPAGIKYTRPVSTLDLLPTILAVAESDIPINLPGENLIPYFKGDKKDEPTDVHYWRWMGQRAVRAGDWKWVSHPRQNVVGLFNLAEDESEENNLLELNPEKAAELENLWKIWNKKNSKPLWRSEAELERMSKEYGGEGMQ